MESRAGEEDADVGLHWVLAVVEGVDCAHNVVVAMLFSCVFVPNTSQKVDKVGVVDPAQILEAARAVHSLWLDPVVQSWQARGSVQELKMRQALWYGELSGPKWVKASANWSSARAAHSSKVGTPMKVWMRLSDLISHSSPSRKQSMSALENPKSVRLERRWRNFILQLSNLHFVNWRIVQLYQ